MSPVNISRLILRFYTSRRRVGLIWKSFTIVAARTIRSLVKWALSTRRILAADWRQEFTPHHSGSLCVYKYHWGFEKIKS